MTKQLFCSIVLGGREGNPTMHFGAPTKNWVVAVNPANLEIPVSIIAASGQLLFAGTIKVYPSKFGAVPTFKFAGNSDLIPVAAKAAIKLACEKYCLELNALRNRYIGAHSAAGGLSERVETVARNLRELQNLLAQAEERERTALEGLAD